MYANIQKHCKPGQLKPTYIIGENGAAAVQVSQVNLFELGPIKQVHLTYLLCCNIVPTLNVRLFNLSWF